MNTNKLITFAHISKCAGTTVTRSLLPHLQPAFEVHFRQQDLSFIELMKDLPEKQYRYVYGHLWHRQIDTFLPKIPHFAFSFIRHPIERIISHYRFDLTPAVPWHKENIERWQCFEEYCFGIRKNYIKRYLVGDHVETLEQYIEEAEKRYDFIGIKEYFDKSMVRLCAALGIPYTPIPDQNVTQINQFNGEIIKPETIERLNKIHALDIQFWEYIMRKYDTKTD